MDIEEIITTLRQKGCRITILRRKLLELLLAKNEPASVQTLLQGLELQGFTPNQTTVYRQLYTLVKHQVVDVVTLDVKVQFFEIAKEHHHHFVCEACNDVQDFHSDQIESAFYQFEKLLQTKGLSVNKHELTFFGECQSCN